MKKEIFFLIVALILTFNCLSQEIEQSINKSAFKYFDILKENNTNLVFSPTSINSAIALTYIGSKNNTLKEISQSLYYNNNIEDFNKAYKSFSSINFFDNKTINIYNANSLWIQEKLKLENDYKLNTEKYFNSSVYGIDFSNNTNSLKRINNWVYKKTNGNISDLIKSSDIDNSTRLVLINTIYFKGLWNKQFNKKKNTKEKFEYKRKRFTQTVFMHNTINSWYYEDNNFCISEIPYSNNKVSLIIIMPKSLKRRKLRKAYQNLNIDLYNTYDSKKERKKINLSLPKFDIESDFNLNKTLNQLGIKNAFTSEADFSGITKEENLFINKVIHKAKITVNEEGTEASAATAVIMRKTSINIDTIDFNINKPFVYILKNNKTGLIYFMGQVHNPVSN